MAERMGWISFVSLIGSAGFGLCFYGFCFLNSRVEASQDRSDRQITSIRAELTSRFDKFELKQDKLNDKIDALLRRSP